jgi:hypothetical protein
MNLDPDQMAAILRGARKCPDNTRDAFFAHVAERLRFFSEPLTVTIAEAVKRFGTAPSKRPRRE